MHISKEIVEHLARLSLLELTPEEIQKYTKEFNSLIEYFEKLSELDTSNVEPTYHVIASVNVLREDLVYETFQVSDLIQNAPAHEDGTIKVPKIIEGQ